MKSVLFAAGTLVVAVFAGLGVAGGGSGTDSLRIATVSPQSTAETPVTTQASSATTMASPLVSLPSTPDEPASTIPAPSSPTDDINNGVEVASVEIVRLEAPAIWPAAHVVFTDPITAAADFIDAEVLGDYEPRDARSGEIVVYRRDDGGNVTGIERSRLDMRRLAPTDGWYVVEARSAEAAISHPVAGTAVVAGPVVVEGEAEGFEANMVYLAHLAGDRDVRFDLGHTGVGFSDPIPYRIAVDLSTAPAGSTAVIEVQADSGIGQGGFSAIPVVVLDEIPATS